MLAKLPSYIVVAGLIADARRIHGHDEHADAGMRLGLAVGARGQEHVLAPVGGGPDLLPGDHPLVAVADRAGAQRRQVGAGLGLAVAHAVHRLAAQDLGQVALLLLGRAEHHQRVRLDRGADARRLGALHHLDEGDLLERRARLAAELARPAEAEPAGLAEVAGEGRVELAVVEVLAVERRLALAAPVLLQPGADLGAKGVAGGAEVVFGQRSLGVVEQVHGELAPRRGGAAEREAVEMGAAEVARRLVLLGVADGAEGMLGLERRLAQRRAAEGDRGGGEVAPRRGRRGRTPRPRARA